MTEKTPINPTEIREGDTIRWEGIDERRGTRLAIEYIAHHDGDDRSWSDDGGEYYLLKRFERPTSPVPNVDTLGYLHHGGRLILGVWRTHDYRPHVDGVGRSALQNERDIPVDQVTGFTQAIAVPVADETDAACAWSDYRKDYEPSAVTLAAAHKAFLAGWKAREGDQSGPIR